MANPLEKGWDPRNPDWENEAILRGSTPTGRRKIEEARKKTARTAKTLHTKVETVLETEEDEDTGERGTV